MRRGSVWISAITSCTAGHGNRRRPLTDSIRTCAQRRHASVWVHEPAVGQHIDGLVRRVLPAMRRGCGSSTARPRRRLSVRPAGPRKRRTRLAASSGSRPEPSMKMISCSCPSARSKGTWMAAQGRGRPLPCRKAATGSLPAGLRSVPLRAKNSVLSPLKVRFASATSRGGLVSKPRMYGFCAKTRLPYSGQTLVITMHPRDFAVQILPEPIPRSRWRRDGGTGPIRFSPLIPSI